MKPDQNYYIWQQHNITLNKSDIYGYGIAISGGTDSSSTAIQNDTSVYVSDVINSGPADGKLLVNDKILSINGINVQNAEHKFVVNLLKESNNFINLDIMRKVERIGDNTNGLVQQKKLSQPPPPSLQPQKYNQISPHHHKSIQKPMKIQLIKKDRKDNLGLVLGYKCYIKDIIPKSMCDDELCGLSVGDYILKINDIPIEQMSLVDAKKMLYKTRDKINLVIRRDQFLQQQQQLLQNEYGQQDPLAQSCQQQAQLIYQNSPQIDGYLLDEAKLYKTSSASVSQTNGLLAYRKVSFIKENGVGIRITGGNRIGIFVCDVQINSAAERAGLQIADKIFQVNDVDYRNLTREDAVQHILSLQNQIEMVVANMPDDYKASFDPIGGDSFYIRANFNFTGTIQNELSFKINDILHITDTLFNGIIGHWVATRIDMSDNGEANKSGIIPNETNARQLIANAPTIDQVQASTKTTLSRRLRNSTRRNRSQSTNEDNTGNFKVFKANTYDTKYPVYERVTLKEANFIRPVVIFGALADIARDKLVNDYPEKYELPVVTDCINDTQGQRSNVIKLANIRSVIEKGLHCVLDITPNAVEHLNYAQYHPIVVYLKSDSHAQVKEIRQKYLKTTKVRNSKRLHENAVKLQTYNSHLLTAQISLESSSWFKKLKNAIDSQQKQPLWITDVTVMTSGGCQKPNGSQIKTFIQVQRDASYTNGRNGVQPQQKPFQANSAQFDDNFELQLYNVRNNQSCGNQSGYDSESDYGVCEPITPFSRPQSVYSSYGELKRIMLQNGHNADYIDYALSNGHVNANKNGNLVRIYSDSNLFKIDNGYDDEHPIDNNGVQIPITYEAYPQNNGYCNHDYGNTAKMANEQPQHQNVYYTNTQSGQLESKLSHLKIKDNIDIFDRLNGFQQSPNTDISLQDTKTKLTNQFLLTTKPNDANRNSFNSLKNCGEAYKFTRSTAMPVVESHTLKPSMLKTSITTSMIDSLKRPVNRNGATAAANAPPILPKPKHLSTTYLSQQQHLRATGMKSKSEINIAQLHQHRDHKEQQQEQHIAIDQQTSSITSSSSPSSSSVSTNAINASINPSSTMHKQAAAAAAVAAQFKIEDKIKHKLQKLEMNSLKSSSQGYYSDTSRSSKQSCEFESVRANLRKVKKPPQYNDGDRAATATATAATPEAVSAVSSNCLGANKELTNSVSSMSDDVSTTMPTTTNSNTQSLSFNHALHSSNSHAFPANLYFKENNYESINRELTGRSYSAHYNDNGSYRRVSIDSNDVCTVIASIDGIFDSRGGILDCPNTGVSIYIPEDAIPKDTSYEVYFKVSHCQSATASDEDQLIYPVVMCGPRGLKFQKPIELIIPNFILIDNKSWSYTVSSHDGGDYNNWTSDGHKTTKNSVSVLIDHF